MRRIIGIVGHAYRDYKTLMWAGSLLATFGIPVGSYGMYVIQTIKTNRAARADNPELAVENTPADPLEFLRDVDVSGIAGNIAHWAAVIGLVLLVFTLTVKTISTVGAHTEISGEDKTLKERDRQIEEDADDEYEDDYGETSF